MSKKEEKDKKDKEKNNDPGWKKPQFTGLRKLAEKVKFINEIVLEEHKKKLENLKGVLEAKRHQQSRTRGNRRRARTDR